MENDNRNNAFIKFKWPEPEDHSSISEDMACATRVRIYFVAKKKRKNRKLSSGNVFIANLKLVAVNKKWSR